jgi:hypothetical protein
MLGNKEFQRVLREISQSSTVILGWILMALEGVMLAVAAVAPASRAAEIAGRTRAVAACVWLLLAPTTFDRIREQDIVGCLPAGLGIPCFERLSVPLVRGYRPGGPLGQRRHFDFRTAVTAVAFHRELAVTRAQAHAC